MAFAFATNTEAKEDIITEWPGAGNQTKQKVTTVAMGHFWSRRLLTNGRFLPCYTTISTKKSSDGVLILQMLSRQPAILNQGCRR